MFMTFYYTFIFYNSYFTRFIQPQGYAKYLKHDKCLKNILNSMVYFSQRRRLYDQDMYVRFIRIDMKRLRQSRHGPSVNIHLQRVLCWLCSVYFNASPNEDNPVLGTLETRLNLYRDYLTYELRPSANRDAIIRIYGPIPTKLVFLQLLALSKTSIIVKLSRYSPVQREFFAEIANFPRVDHGGLSVAERGCRGN